MKKAAPLALALLCLVACKQEETYDQKVPQNVTKQIADKKAAEATPAPQAAVADAKSVANPEKVDLGGGLYYKITTEGSGEGLKAGDTPNLKTVLTTPEGKVIWQGDFSFTIGLTPPKAVAGYDKGVVGMKKGEKRTIFVPAAMGYGVVGMPPQVPSNQDLVFTVSRP